MPETTHVPPTVFILHPSDFLTDHRPNGDGLVAHGFIRGLATRGVRLHVAASEVDLREPLPPNVTLYPLAKRTRLPGLDRIEYMIRARLLLRRLRRTERIDLAHQMNPVFAGLSLGLLGCGLPIVLGTFIARWPFETLGTDRRVPLRERLSAVLRRVITFPQQFDASALLLTTPAARDRLAAPALFAAKVHTVRHGIDADWFRPASGWQAAALARTVPSILFYSQVDPRKGIYVLMDAYRRVLERLPDCRLTIAGRGSEIEAIRAIVAALDRPDQVEILGPVDRALAPALFGRHGVYCLPSFGEPYGMTALEAMSCASALVITDAGGLPDVVPPEGGLRVPPGDAQALADALVEVLRSPARQVAMGEANRAWIERHHTWDRVVDSLLAVYRHVAAEPRAR